MQRLEQYDVFDIPIESIYYDASFNCRGAFTPQSVKDLADSIAQHGLQLPVIVQPINDANMVATGSYQWRLIAGHRRYVAVRTFLQWASIPATVRSGLSEHQARLLNLTENLERKDLNILEEAKSIRNLYPEGVSVRVAARELKRPTRWVHIRLRLLGLPEAVQEKAAAGLLSAVNLEAILAIDDPTAQIAAAAEICAIKAKGRTKFDARLQRPFRAAKSKEHISQMIANMLNRGVSGLGPRALAWAAGYISDAELEADITRILSGEPVIYQPVMPRRGGRPQKYRNV